MSFVIVCMGLAGHTLVDSGPVPVGWFLESADVDDHDGRGSCAWTADREDALTFPTQAEAHAFWTQRSRVRPTREDGEPNRPLTAFTVLVEQV